MTPPAGSGSTRELGRRLQVEARGQALLTTASGSVPRPAPGPAGRRAFAPPAASPQGDRRRPHGPLSPRRATSSFDAHRRDRLCLGADQRPRDVDGGPGRRALQFSVPWSILCSESTEPRATPGALRPRRLRGTPARRQRLLGGGLIDQCWPPRQPPWLPSPGLPPTRGRGLYRRQVQGRPRIAVDIGIERVAEDGSSGCRRSYLLLCRRHRVSATPAR